MSRGHVQTRVSEQIRTLFEAGSLGGLTDAQLLERYLSPEGPGSETAFAALVERHGPMVLGVCRRLLLDTHLAEDAFQATFLVLARRAKSVRNHDSLGGWLHRVARRIAMRLRLTTERKKARERAWTNPETFAVEYADRVASDELRSVIDHEIDHLAESNRLPVVLCCLEGLSHEEASQRLRWPLGTVKSRLARGRKRLQERLLRRGFAPSVAIGAGAGLLAAGEASAAVPPALLDATTKAAAAIAAGSSISGVVPASLAALAQTEVSAMLATKLKLAAGIPLAAGAAAILVGFVLTGASEPEGKPDANDRRRDRRSRRSQGASGVRPTRRRGSQPPATWSTNWAGPIANARVILREWSEFRVRGRPPAEMEKLIRGAGVNDILAETSTDAAGRFRFVSIPAPAFPDVPEADQAYPWDIVALAPGRGLAWIQLTREQQRHRNHAQARAGRHHPRPDR